MAEEFINYERAFDLVRQKAAGGKNRQEFIEGQRFIESREAMDLMPPVGARTIQGLDDDIFDGDTALSDMKGKLDVLREQRDARLTKRNDK